MQSESNVRPLEVVPQAAAKSTPTPKTKKTKPSLTQAELRAKRRKDEIDLSDALVPYSRCDHRDVEIAIRCIAYLMEWPTDAGNYSLDGRVASGLSDALRLCAERVNALYDRDTLQFEIQHCGGDSRKSPALSAIYGSKE